MNLEECVEESPNTGEQEEEKEEVFTDKDFHPNTILEEEVLQEEVRYDNNLYNDNSSPHSVESYQKLKHWNTKKKKTQPVLL